MSKQRGEIAASVDEEIRRDRSRSLRIADREREEGAAAAQVAALDESAGKVAPRLEQPPGVAPFGALEPERGVAQPAERLVHELGARGRVALGELERGGSGIGVQRDDDVIVGGKAVLSGVRRPAIGAQRELVRLAAARSLGDALPGQRRCDVVARAGNGVEPRERLFEELARLRRLLRAGRSEILTQRLRRGGRVGEFEARRLRRGALERASPLRERRALDDLELDAAADAAVAAAGDDRPLLAGARGEGQGQVAQALVGSDDIAALRRASPQAHAELRAGARSDDDRLIPLRVETESRVVLAASAFRDDVDDRARAGKESGEVVLLARDQGDESSCTGHQWANSWLGRDRLSASVRSRTDSRVRRLAGSRRRAARTRQSSSPAGRRSGRRASRRAD